MKSDWRVYQDVRSEWLSGSAALAVQVVFHGLEAIAIRYGAAFDIKDACTMLDDVSRTAQSVKSSLLEARAERRNNES